MFKFIFFIFCYVFTLPAIAQKQYIVDEHAVMRNLEGQFNSVQVAGDVKVYITQSDQFAIAVSTAGKAEDILTTITGNSLHISRSESGSWNRRRNEAVVYVAMPVIEKIMLSGASTIKMIGTIKADNLELLLSGASELSGTLQADNLVMNLSGASDAFLSGAVNQLSVACSGASDVKSYGLEVNFCTARASGASDILLTIHKQLQANASGASQVLFKGEAILQSYDAKGASIISRKEK
jgi:hypothetical protein